MKLSRYLLLPFFLGLAIFSNSTDAKAQGFAIGPEVGLILDGTNLLVGVNATKDFEVSEYLITGNVVFDYYLIDGGSLTGIEIAGLYNLSPQESFSPYVGGGLSILNFSVDTEIEGLDFGFTNTGLFAKGGANLAQIGAMQPFVEAALYLDGTDIVLKGGVRWAMGGE